MFTCLFHCACEHVSAIFLFRNISSSFLLKTPRGKGGLYIVVELVGGGSVINGATPSSLQLCH